MDAVAFEKLIGQLARAYYGSPRSKEVPTPYGPVDLARMEVGASNIWVMEDFANWLKDGDDRTQRERMKPKKQFAVDQRVHVIERVECYPNFIIEKGATGIVVEVNKLHEHYEVRVRMDEHVNGCEEWDNVVFFNEDAFPPEDYLEVIP